MDKVNSSLNRVTDSCYVQQQVSRLEKLAHQLQIQRYLQDQKDIGLGSCHNGAYEETREESEEDEIQAKLWSEIIQLRNQLKQLKFESEGIQSSYLQKNREAKIMQSAGASPIKISET